MVRYTFDSYKLKMADDPDPGHKLVRRSSLGKGSKKRRMSKKKYDGRSIMDDMVGVSDMVLLDPLTEDKLVENLEKRFNAGEIYVSSRLLNYLSKVILTYLEGLKFSRLKAKLNHSFGVNFFKFHQTSSKSLVLSA